MLVLNWFHAKLSSQLGSGTIWASELTIGLGLCVYTAIQYIHSLYINCVYAPLWCGHKQLGRPRGRLGE